MKFSVQPFLSDRTQFRYVRCVAIIPKSKKLGIPRQFQRTWKVRTVAPEFTTEEMRASFEAEAKRWEQKIMRNLAMEKATTIEERQEIMV